jgi:hypothetical protein
MAIDFGIAQREPIAGQGGLLTQPWIFLFRKLFEKLSGYGEEQSFNLVNNQSSAADIKGLKFDSRFVGHAVLEYFARRITTGSGATTLHEAGILIFTYNPVTEAWEKVTVSEHNPNDAGIVLTITAAGQVQYTTSNITGTASISTIYWRTRTLGAKNVQFSSVGGRGLG